MGNYFRPLLVGCLTIVLNTVIVRNSLCQKYSKQVELETKLYSLSKVWSECEFNFPYFKFLDQHIIDSIYRKSLADVIVSTDDFSYYLIMRKFLASFRDNHTYYTYPKSIQSQLNRSQFMGVRLEASLIEGKAVITRIGRNNAIDIPIGSEILFIDSIKVSYYLNSHIKPFLSSSSEQRLNEIAVKNIFLGLDGSSFTVTIKKPNNDIATFKLTRADNEDEWLPLLKTSSFVSKLNDNICQIKIGSFNDFSLIDSLSSHMEQLSHSKGIIIDLRGNTGGNSILACKIASFFIHDSIIYGSLVSTRKNLAINRAYGLRYPISDTSNESRMEDILYARNLFLENVGISKNQNEFSLRKISENIEIVILIDALNISAAEEFLIYLKDKKNITFIGEATGGGNGSPMIILLPDGGSASICTQYWAFSDGTDYYRKGIQPEITIYQTYKDFLQGIDTVMEFAIKYLRNNTMK